MTQHLALSDIIGTPLGVVFILLMPALLYDVLRARIVSFQDLWMWLRGHVGSAAILALRLLQWTVTVSILVLLVLFGSRPDVTDTHTLSQMCILAVLCILKIWVVFAMVNAILQMRLLLRGQQQESVAVVAGKGATMTYAQALDHAVAIRHRVAHIPPTRVKVVSRGDGHFCVVYSAPGCAQYDLTDLSLDDAADIIERTTTFVHRGEVTT